MTTDSHSTEQRELIRRLFYLMTSIGEDAAAHAADGQSANVDDASVLEFTNRLHSAGQSLIILADAARLLGGGEH